MTARETILVTGAGGFLGSAVAHALLDAGHRVLAFDRVLDQGRLRADPGLIRETGDVRDAERVRELVARATRVVHFAAIAGVHTYLERPLEVLDVNLLGTRNVLAACLEENVPVLTASTSEAYGKNPNLLREDGDSWLGPTTNARWCYATSKIAGEHYAWGMAREGLAVAAVRYFNVYGPLLDAPGTGRVLSQFLGAMQRGEPLALVDGGHAVRCLCFIDDAVRATLGLLMALGPGSPLIGRPFNVGNPEPVTMRALAQAVIRLSGYPQGTVDVPGPDFFGPGFEDIPHRVPDTDALRDATGFEARVPLEEGLRRVLGHWGLLAPTPRPVPVEPIPVLRPHYDADPSLLLRLGDALAAGRTTNHGVHAQGLEREAATWLGVAPVLAVASGAAGLEVALRALGRRGRALLPSFTYIATLNAVEAAGLEPVLVDVDPATWTMDPAHVAALLAGQTNVGVVLPVNVFGVPPDLPALGALAHAAGAALVYDDAHGFGTTVRGARADTTPDVTVYSLHATKILPAIEGGLIWTADAALADRMRAVRTHGLTPDPRDAVPGFNGKIDELSAAVARHGLSRFDATLARRRAYGDRLTAALRARPEAFVPQAVPEGVHPNHQNLCVRVRAPFANATATLDAHGVGWRRYFDPPLHHLRRLPPVTLPHTEALWASLVCLPLHSRMSEAALSRIEAALAAVPAP